MGLRGPTRTAFAVVLTALTAAVLSGTASAATRHSRVVFKGKGSYGLRYVETSGRTFKLSATFNFRTEIPSASFTEGTAGARESASLRSSSYSGAWTASVTDRGGISVCKGSGRFGNPASGTPAPSLKYTWSAQTGRFTVDSFTGLPGNALRTTSRHANDCSSQLPSSSAGSTSSADFWRDWLWNFSGIGGRRHDVLDARFSFAGSLLSAARATESINTTSSNFPAACRSLAFHTCTQSYKWSGTVQFTRTG